MVIDTLLELRLEMIRRYPNWFMCVARITVILTFVQGTVVVHITKVVIYIQVILGNLILIHLSYFLSAIFCQHIIQIGLNQTKTSDIILLIWIEGTVSTPVIIPHIHSFVLVGDRQVGKGVIMDDGPQVIVVSKCVVAVVNIRKLRTNQ
ncbi:hypothetical protein BMS3Bbin04_00019 [bacterium BMS3Bbin04]|nr:hypothetical protein BMS3Bbin04_00019 [bacterium BMS3Bbin04]